MGNKKLTRREVDVSHHFSCVSLKDARLAIDELIDEYGEGAKLNVEQRYIPFDPDPDASVILSYCVSKNIGE